MASLRTDRAGLVLVSLLAASCMRIYPDPDLPDVKVSWYQEVCTEDAGDVVVVLIGLDSDSRMETTAPCVGPDVVFADVPREQYRIEATLFDTAGNLLVQTAWDADLRDGIDEKVELYFNPYSTFRVAWTFDAGESCASLGAEVVAIELSPAIEQAVQYADCRDTPYYGYVRNGTYTMRIRAESAIETVAISAESAPFTLTSLDVTDVGTMPLSPCAPSCPTP